jgi:hypothetical protein
MRGQGAPTCRLLGFALGALLLAGCSDGLVDEGGFGADTPPPPLALVASYYNRGVDLGWEQHPDWRGDTFRIYVRRVGAAGFTSIAEVTSCGADGVCQYRDLNVQPGERYQYRVAAVSPLSGVETLATATPELLVPNPTPPPAPNALRGVALDGAAFLSWGTESRANEGFAFYRVYLFDKDTATLLGETDSEGFLDLLVRNGFTYGYFVTAVDRFGHESAGSVLVQVTPRPDFRGELLFAFEDRPTQSGFRFPDEEGTNPVLSGTHPNRDFRMEMDESGWWLVPAPGRQVLQVPLATTALRCGPGADAGCVELSVAPATGYGTGRAPFRVGTSLVVRVPDGQGQIYYGVVRTLHTGLSAQGGVVLFDWAFQLQPGNPALMPVFEPAQPDS